MLSSQVTGEDPSLVIMWYPGHAFVLPQPSGESSNDLVRSPKFEDLIQIGEEKALGLCRTCNDCRNAEHYGQVPPKVFTDSVYFETDCGGPSQRPCQNGPVCHKHQEWDGYLARRRSCLMMGWLIRKYRFSTSTHDG